MCALAFRSASLSLIVLSLGLMAATPPVQAQSISVKPGLWASASVNTLNGPKMPTIFDIKGALTAEQKSSLSAAMAKVGLPAGGSPHLACQQSAEFSLPKPESVEQCTTQVKPANDSAGTFTMSCKSEMVSGTGVGTYEVKDKTTATVKVSFKATTAQGQPLSYDSSSVHKWIGGDCNTPPAGVDPALMTLMR